MLQLAIFDGYGGSLLADYSSRALNARPSTAEHGFEALSFDVPMTMGEAYSFYSHAGNYCVSLTDGTFTAWEGRLEDVAISDEGVSCVAYGYWRAFSDLIYSGIWIKTGTTDWKVFTTADRALSSQRFDMDTSERIYIALRKDEEYPYNKLGTIGWNPERPDTRKLTHVTFDYSVFLETDYYTELVSVSNGDWFGGTQVTEWTLTGNGASQTGSAAITLAGTNVSGLLFFMASLTTVTNAEETGDRYVAITNLVVKTAASVPPDVIAGALVDFVEATNPAQINSNKALILAPGITLTNEAYRDTQPADILTMLASLGDNATPPRLWEVGVWEGQRSVFRARGSAGRAWYVDVTALNLQSTIETLYNSVYATYQDSNGKAIRSASATNAASITRYGLVRETSVSVTTDVAARATAQRDSVLSDNAIPKPRASLSFKTIYDVTGAPWPLYCARYGDTITIRNLPPTLGTAVDRIRTFTISHTEYDCGTNVLTVEPEAAPSTLGMQIARLARRVK